MLSKNLALGELKTSEIERMLTHSSIASVLICSVDIKKLLDNINLFIVIYSVVLNTHGVVCIFPVSSYAVMGNNLTPEEKQI